jgi:hypothetical protein
MKRIVVIYIITIIFLLSLSGSSLDVPLTSPILEGQIDSESKSSTISEAIKSPSGEVLYSLDKKILYPPAGEYFPGSPICVLVELRCLATNPLDQALIYEVVDPDLAVMNLTFFRTNSILERIDAYEILYNISGLNKSRFKIGQQKISISIPKIWAKRRIYILPIIY